MYSGEMSTFSVAFGKKLARDMLWPTVVRNNWKIHENDFHSAPTPSPLNTVPPSRFSPEIASTAIGIDALTVRPARRPRYTVDAPKINPKSTPMTIALAVNSAGDCVGRTYG